MANLNIQEGKSVIAAIVKENGTTKQIKTPAGANITYGSPLDTLVFLECATSYSDDTSKSINKTDIVGTQNQKISEGSLEETFSYDAQVLDPVALGDTTIVVTDNPVHGLDGSVDPQYLVTSLGLRKAIASGNTYTIRIFYGCDLDANGDADVTTAKEVYDLEKCHISSNSVSISAGAEVTMSIAFDAERRRILGAGDAWNTAPN